jgi:hypothetical protein
VIRSLFLTHCASLVAASLFTSSAFAFSLFFFFSLRFSFFSLSLRFRFSVEEETF